MVKSSSMYTESFLRDQANFSITLCIDSRLEHIQLVRVAMSAVLRHFDVVESDIYGLELAVSEIIDNSLEHGYKGRVDEKVEVRIELCGAEVQIEVSDSAPQFPEKELYRLQGELQPLADADEEWPTRGHGLQIVRQIVDSIALHSESHCNRMTLRKHVGLRDN
jgi:stage II sporulation protein AB (anti-sigma F factor)